MAVKKLDTENFNAEIANGTVLVDFYADWCGPCKMMAPIIEQIAAERSDITVGKINIDESPQLAAAFGIESIPTIIAFKDGKAVNKAIGYRPKDNILSML